MTTHWLRSMAMVGAALVLAACGGGSGRGGTDLVVTATGPDGEVRGGETIVFTMTVENDGENDAEDVVIQNAVGNVLLLTAITCEAEGGAVCPEVTSPVMNIPEIRSGGRLVFEVSATVTAGANGTLTNTLSANFTDEIDRANNSATAIATAVASDTNVEASVSAGPYDPGVDYKFTAVFGNAGPATAIDVVLSYEQLTSNMELGELSCVADGGAEPPVQQDDGTWRSASIPVDGSLTCELPFRVSDRLTFGITFNVSATGEAKLSDNTDTVRSNQP